MILVLFLVTFAHGYQRLSTEVHPTKYHLIIHPSFDSDLTFQGNLSILLVANNTDTFSLDCEGLNVTWTSLMMNHKWGLAHTFAQENNRLVIKSDDIMTEVYPIELNITFKGYMRKDLSGFYVNQYEYRGTQRILASTHFESNSARKAFPCFDEPSFRASFNLEILVDPTMNALSNTLADSNVVQNGLRRITFAERPSTPTYLVAWVIYDIDSFRGTSKNVKTNCAQNSSLNYSIWSDTKYENETELALNSAPEIVSALEDFTGIKCEAVKYKMDLVAVPDFQAGAMENWELITFRESALLYNNVSSTILDKQMTLMIVAHELVHQWFGNLVTPHWWSYIWLNEGFARYLQYVIADQLNPEMQLDEQFLVDRRQIALQNDGPHAHPLTNYNITSNDDISDMFDIITYDKGASVIHMWSSTIGQNSFKDGINQYLNNVVRSGGVSSPDYLFSALFDNTEFHDKKLGVTWTEYSGYPIVVAAEHNSTLRLNQITVTGWNTTVGHWFIPVTISVNDRVMTHTMEPHQSLAIDLDPKSSYVININQTGYYRVMYKNMSRWLLTNITDMTRSMLIDDALAHSNAGLLPYNVSMAIASHHLESIGYLPWLSALRAFSTVYDVLRTTQFESMWREHVLGLMGNVMQKVALNDSLPGSHILMLHKMNLLKHGCNFGHEICLNEANKIAKNFSYGTPEKRSALLCTTVKLGNDETWNQIYARYNFSNSPTEKQLFLKALTCSSNRTTIQKFLQLLFTKEIKRQDVTSTIALICESPEGSEETFKFIKNNFMQVHNYFDDPRTVTKILLSSTKFINDSQLAQIKQMSSLLTGLNVDSIITKLEQALIMKKRNIRMIKEFLVPENTEMTTEKDKGEISNNSSDTDSGSSRINVQILWFVLFIVTSSLNIL